MIAIQGATDCFRGSRSFQVGSSTGTFSHTDAKEVRSDTITLRAAACTAGQIKPLPAVAFITGHA